MTSSDDLAWNYLLLQCELTVRKCGHRSVLGLSFFLSKFSTIVTPVNVVLKAVTSTTTLTVQKQPVTA